MYSYKNTIRKIEYNTRTDVNKINKFKLLVKFIHIQIKSLWKIHFVCLSLMYVCIYFHFLLYTVMYGCLHKQPV